MIPLGFFQKYKIDKMSVPCKHKHSFFISNNGGVAQLASMSS